MLQNIILQFRHVLIFSYTPSQVCEQKRMQKKVTRRLNKTWHQLNIKTSRLCTEYTINVFSFTFMQIQRKFEKGKVEFKRLIIPFLLYSCQLHWIWRVHRGHMCALSWCVPSYCVNAKDGYPWFIHREVVECLMAHY